MHPLILHTLAFFAGITIVWQILYDLTLMRHYGGTHRRRELLQAFGTSKWQACWDLLLWPMVTLLLLLLATPQLQWRGVVLSLTWVWVTFRMIVCIWGCASWKASRFS